MYEYKRTTLLKNFNVVKHWPCEIYLMAKYFQSTVATVILLVEYFRNAARNVVLMIIGP